MQTKFKTVLALASLAFLCGCFQVEVYHKLERYGNSDRGGWRVAMDNAAYALFLASEHYGSFISQARSFSNPTVRGSGGKTYIEDVSGRASMEHIYDDYNCWADPNSSRHMICEFSTSDTDLDFMGWEVDWTVELEPDMVMISSNHHRTRVENGKRQYLWYFDGDRVSSYNITYRVRNAAQARGVRTR